MKLEPEQGKKSSTKGKAERKMITVKVVSYICEPINPRIVALNEKRNTDFPSLPESGATWGLEPGELEFLGQKLWSHVSAHSALSLVPVFGAGPDFPYSDITGMVQNVYNFCNSIDGFTLLGACTLRSELASEAMAKLSVTGSSRFQCYQCLGVIEAKGAREHVAVHILKAMRGVAEDPPLKGRPVSVYVLSTCVTVSLTTVFAY